MQSDRRRGEARKHRYSSGEAEHDCEIARDRQSGRRLLRRGIHQKTGGGADDVTDQEIRDGIQLLAETEGIFTETAGGVAVGVTKKLVDQGKIDRNGITVIAITGNGLKTPEAVNLPNTSSHRREDRRFRGTRERSRSCRLRSSFPRRCENTRRERRSSKWMPPPSRKSSTSSNRASRDSRQRLRRFRQPATLHQYLRGRRRCAVPGESQDSDTGRRGSRHCSCNFGRLNEFRSDCRRGL